MLWRENEIKTFSMCIWVCFNINSIAAQAAHNILKLVSTYSGRITVVSPQLKVVSPQLKVVSPPLKVSSPEGFSYDLESNKWLN